MENPPDIGDYLDELHEEHFLKDPYRISPSVCLMNKNGTWNDYNIPEFKEWAEDCLFPWAGMRSQIAIITTEKGKNMAPHMDCWRSSFNDWQHKFRYVIRGNTSDLRFLTKTGPVTPPDLDQCYVIDGSWLHDMVNTYDGRKYTMCFGSPWNPQDDPDYTDKLLEAYIENGDYYISSDNLDPPDNYREYFNAAYD